MGFGIVSSVKIKKESIVAFCLHLIIAFVTGF